MTPNVEENQMRAFDQQLELLVRLTKEMKYDIDSMKQQVNGVDHRGNTI